MAPLAKVTFFIPGGRRFRLLISTLGLPIESEASITSERKSLLDTSFCVLGNVTPTVQAHRVPLFASLNGKRQSLDSVVAGSLGSSQFTHYIQTDRIPSSLFDRCASAPKFLTIHLFEVPTECQGTLAGKPLDRVIRRHFNPRHNFHWAVNQVRVEQRNRRHIERLRNQHHLPHMQDIPAMA
ncbi:hypothetical protein MTX37_15055 [Rhodococcus sp. ARC_M8]|jgi:hypothetical protein|uniref:hypothetical protein n=1 Tax=Rhodococcus TaxID=1827 RepID=UPI001EDFBDFE|nr:MULTISPECIES: hypothetical protein [Rhodococcus]MCJ0947220.1 hypothetical protein [Rhodococcus sp. ARC_M8]UKO87801.1 hypothetical protein ITJ47_08350 [Rhodococcus erythropolis]ULD39440.1 hypothetical protein JKI97_17960 [Rhodococcus qingshengii]